MAVVIETTLGDFTVDLFTEERPQTCKNFLKLCKIKYYNFCLFHSVQANFLAQTGDPTGSGTGGESVFGIVYGNKSRYYEGEKLPKLKHTKPGLLSMVNCGSNMLGSQFFLTLGSELQSLDEHCVFGEITEGMDILLKLNETICDNQHRPYKDIRITHTVILEDPFEDPSGLVIPECSPEPNQLTLQNGRIGADEEIDETAGMTVAEVEEMKQTREAQARATILEIVGDLPDAEMAPPENVLFVCKLNPVTSDDDLEIIFSRFGKIKSCEVIRDHETGNSLQYAFIEFEEQRACEEAYFKMDNVLIDDRRIHVDFSQSVAKIRWKGKGRGVEYLDKNEKEKSQPYEESKNSSRRNNHRGSKDSKDGKDENHRDSREWSHKKRQEEQRHWRRDGDNDHRRTDKRKFDDCRKSDDRRRQEGFNKKWEGKNQSQGHERRKPYEDRRNYSNNSSRRENVVRRDPSRNEKDSWRRDNHHKEDRGRDKPGRSSSRNRSHSTEQFRSRGQNSPQVKKFRENGTAEEKTVNSETVVDKNKGKTEKDDSLNSSFTASSDTAEVKASEEPPPRIVETEENGKKDLPNQSESDVKALQSRESSDVSEQRLKKKQKTSSSKRKKKRKHSSSSESSSAASDSSSESSSESASSGHKHRHKRKTTVAKKYYHRGKLVKVVKKRKDSSESESFSDSSSDSDRKKKKQRGKKHHTKIVKIIEKRKKRVDSSDDSDSDSSSDDSEDERSKKRKKRKNSEKRKKKKRSNFSKKHKRSKSDSSSGSESDEDNSSRKAKKSKKENDTQNSE